MPLSHRPVRRTAARIASLGVVATLLVGVAAAPVWADSIRDQQWHLGFLNVAEAHRYSQGEGVTVAVIDSGVDATHPDLTGNVLAGTETFAGGTGDGQTDMDGHGTGTAGLIAGHGHGPGNTAGALGIAPKARILPIRTTSQSESDHAAIARGIDYAVAHHATVICIAISSQDFDDERLATQTALAAGVVVVAGVGNKPYDLLVAHPAAYPGVVAAAGVDQDGNHAAISVTGPEAVLAAPAVQVVAPIPNGHYGIGDGTSNATAIIAGAAALVRSRYPSLSGTEVVRRLTTTAIDKGTTGRDKEYGYGVLNLVDALTKDLPPPSPSAQPSPTDRAGTAGPDPNQPHTALAIGLIGTGGLILLTTIVAGTVWLRRRPAG